MPSISRKSAAVALAVVGVAGLSLASAAQLTVGSSSLGAGADVVASCDPDGITVDFGSSFTAGAYSVDSVTLGDVAAACAGLTVSVTLTDASGVVLDDATGPATVGTTTLTGLSAAASAVTDVAVVIAG